MEKGVCTVASLSSLQELHDTVLLKTRETSTMAQDVHTGRGLRDESVDKLLLPRHLDKHREFDVGTTYLARIPPLVYKHFVLRVAINVTSPHPEMSS